MTAPQPLTHAKPPPRYVQVAEVLASEIGAGLFPVGGALPTETALCARFQVSRHTVREALRRLTDAGRISRRQGSGTQVQAAAAQPVFWQSLHSLAELDQYAAETYLQVLARRRVAADARLRAALGGDGPELQGASWLRLRTVRRSRPGGAALCWTTVYVDAAHAAALEGLTETRTPIYRLIEQASGQQVCEVEQTITAEPMPPEAAAALGLDSGGLAVCVTRAYRHAQGGVLELAVSHHPADRFAYRTRLRRAGR